jgi:hypothetical protein
MMTRTVPGCAWTPAEPAVPARMDIRVAGADGYSVHHSLTVQRLRFVYGKCSLHVVKMVGIAVSQTPPVSSLPRPYPGSRMMQGAPWRVRHRGP